MRTRVVLAIAAAVFLFFISGVRPLQAQAMSLTLSITPQTITFPADDPDTSPSVAADRAVQVTIRATGMGTRTWQLTLRANGNLSDFWSLASIAISNVSWTATSVPPFRDGALAANVEQLAATRSGNYQGRGDLTFSLLNSWSYWAGSYSQTVAFTLSAV